MRNRWLHQVLTGSMIVVAGCALLPNSSVPTTSSNAVLNVGLAGSGYSIQSILDTAATGSQSLTFSKILFTPTKIEVHYAGGLTTNEATATPVDIKGETTDQSTVNDGTETTSTSGEWLEFPVENGSAVDLTQLGSNTISFGEDPLKAGKYDMIRITGSGSYEATDASGSIQGGEYTLPSGRLYINQGFEVRDGYKTDLKFAFDAKSAMVVNPANVIMKPSSVKVFALYTLITPVETPSPTASVSPDATESPEATTSI